MAKEDRNLAHAAPETIDELEAFKDWWDAHGNKVTIVLIAVLALVVGFQQFTRWREKSAERAMSAFDQARTPEALEELIAAGKSAAVTPLARLRLAGVYFAEGKYDLSQSVYDAFLKSNGKHPLADVAKLTGTTLVYAGNNDVAAGIRRIVARLEWAHERARTRARTGAALVGGGALYVSDACVNVIAEMEGYVRKRERDGAFSEQPQKRNDHALDALRYLEMAIT